ncbi:hypothetical protein FYZ41_00775 [Mobiluncus mulieris]|uniref:hypothetical protein n=1 Tax=Mobiluncus mulieris TaxID=2052 RepID=UPI0021E2E6FC|nr:hypothetical protein [Mobiluncus mulieris]MCV0010718.1 hypothetical protein [Mobiluncus mulieris]
MNRIVKATGATLLLAAGAAVSAYYTLPAFKETVDEFTSKFRADMAERENALIQALSSTEEEVASARDTWDKHQARRGKHSAEDTEDDDDDLIFD